MEIVNLNKDFLEAIYWRFEHYGFGEHCHESLGYLFSDFFMDAFEEKYKNSKNLKDFLSIDTVEIK